MRGGDARILGYPAARDRRRANIRAALLFAGLAVVMIGVAFAAVPAYRMICALTGLEGTPRIGQASGEIGAHLVKVRFDANINRDMPWRFVPLDREVTVRVGEPVLVHYRATNTSAAAVSGTATFNVTPMKAAQYFVKQECFCFVEQRLEPGQSMDMPVLFSIDPAMVWDQHVNDVGTMTLSYTFFRLPEGEGDSAASSPVDQPDGMPVPTSSGVL
ncbi:cytochrome c oxidase assembly protein [Haematospirillum sp. H1815]|uniref:cytochrome c oxidase assembly protein n=1 Tax=Haematospirillum sp. H1815 TaxID=2723108 RepID=UPI00143BA1B6|nr:cytochrome c oxidase assembly protein [Haematospirillum sp. H1815]NKD76242.1 cytochrome c oxidase assembly protein [Haematospirillum sp. H1815]